MESSTNHGNLQLKLLGLGYGAVLSPRGGDTGPDLYVVIMDFDRGLLRKRLGIRVPPVHDIRLRIHDGKSEASFTLAVQRLTQRESAALDVLLRDAQEQAAAALSITPVTQASQIPSPPPRRSVTESLRTVFGMA